MNITIVGGGFGGVKAALELSREPSNKITLISDHDDFQYYPALYGTATGRSHLQSWVPLGTIFADHHNIRVQIDTIEKIYPDENKVVGLSKKAYHYDKIILALGSVTTYFGIKGLEAYSYGIKSEDEIKRLKQHLHHKMCDHHTMEKKYVIVGAGPTGVELAAALGSYLERLQKRFNLPQSKISIHLIEAAPRVLPQMSPVTSKKVTKRLNKLGVVVQTGMKVESQTADSLTVSGKPIKSHTVIWTSGVANHPFYAINGEYFAFSKRAKIEVDDYMKVLDNEYVIGDNAETPHSGLAQTALHDALFVTKNIRREQRGKKPKKYSAVAPPAIVPVGEHWAVFEWKKLRFSGWLAALLRKVADFIGYSDVLPLGQALGVWHAGRVLEDEYFPEGVCVCED